ncbi:MAG TPA: peptidoglycan DD-metalloendopeptidase family protein [Candidatus Omnitrophota bacterium]|nr:peptidoglycan DD-metalloendopeptidase family protein [Candidatus Omnitrophota bacterium]HPN88154.1 peptidoglycan DD-metalloendopeptidase family protein [Candidatus Omnitrophota bacterium]
MKHAGYHFVILATFFLFSGCATTKLTSEYAHEYPEPEQSGVYHKIKPGETLWRIAKSYDVLIEDIIKANNIPDAARIEKDQLVFIPGAADVKEIILDTEETKNDFIWPVAGKVIRPFRHVDSGFINKGIDIATEKGAFIRAARTGRVVFAHILTGYGQTVILDHQDGLFSVYAHNARLLVKTGDFILKNKEIALSAESNRGAYLHFQIRRNSKEDNPLYYLP